MMKNDEYDDFKTQIFASVFASGLHDRLRVELLQIRNRPRFLWNPSLRDNQWHHSKSPRTASIVPRPQTQSGWRSLTKAQRAQCRVLVGLSDSGHTGRGNTTKKSHSTLFFLSEKLFQLHHFNKFFANWTQLAFRLKMFGLCGLQLSNAERWTCKPRQPRSLPFWQKCRWSNKDTWEIEMVTSRETHTNVCNYAQVQCKTCWLQWRNDVPFRCTLRFTFPSYAVRFFQLKPAESKLGGGNDGLRLAEVRAGTVKLAQVGGRADWERRAEPAGCPSHQHPGQTSLGRRVGGLRGGGRSLLFFLRISGVPPCAACTLIIAS